MRKSLLVFFVLCSYTSFGQSSFQMISSDTPRILGPNIISDGFSNRDMALSPDGNDLYYTLQWTFGTFSVILHSRKVNGLWSQPETAWFSGQYNDLEPAFSPDGRRLFFTSNRPTRADTIKNDYDIWYLEKAGEGWSGPYPAGLQINTDKDEFYPSLAKNGNLYFTRENGDHKDDIFLSVYKNGHYELPQAMPEAVNSKGYDFNAFIDPDENFIIFSSYKRADDLGGGDLYFSLRKNGVWQPARHFGKQINTSTLDYSPFISSDRKYFFYTSKKQLVKFPFSKPQSAEEIRKILSSYGNGNDDIYILNFKVLDQWMTNDPK